MFPSYFVLCVLEHARDIHRSVCACACAWCVCVCVCVCVCTSIFACKDLSTGGCFLFLQSIIEEITHTHTPTREVRCPLMCCVCVQKKASIVCIVCTKLHRNV
jgi:hypothetical protein